MWDSFQVGFKENPKEMLPTALRKYRLQRKRKQWLHSFPQTNTASHGKITGTSILFS